MNNQDEDSIRYLDNGIQFISRTPSDDVRKISDPIHGFIYFDKLIWSIIDTPVYQRLRHIKQLGTTTYVFQGANHTRFEHCLGVGHLAQKFMRVLLKNNPELTQNSDYTDKLTQLVTIAGVIHDLGHGPFSHMFDNVLIPKLTNYNNNVKWTHEQGSGDLFRYLCQEYKIDLTSIEIEFIIDLVNGGKSTHSDGKSRWMYDIVSNERNGMDVDKFDYIMRDCYSTGAFAGINVKLLMKEARVIDDQICYPTKYSQNVYDVFYTRYKLYKSVYLNRVSQSVEQMMCDILEQTNHHYRLEQIIYKPELYYKLNDTIIEQIDSSNDITFTKAQAIIKRIKTRDLYHFVSEVRVKYEQTLDSIEIIKKNIMFYSTETEPIDESKFYVNVGQLGYGTKNENPVNKIGFFRKSNPKEIEILQQDQLSFCFPVAFCEKYVRIFVSDYTQQSRVKAAFEKYCSEHLKHTKIDDLYETPIKVNPNLKSSRRSTPYKETPIKETPIKETPIKVTPRKATPNQKTSFFHPSDKVPPSKPTPNQNTSAFPPSNKVPPSKPTPNQNTSACPPNNRRTIYKH